MEASKVRLKLLIDTKNHKVLLAEAGKDFVDFLFYLLSLPVGAVCKLLKQKNMEGSLINLYDCIENLSDAYMQQSQNKNSVLNPLSSLHVTQIPLMLSEPESNTRKFYACPYLTRYSCHYVSDAPEVPCPSCRRNMSYALIYVSPSTLNANVSGTDAEVGFVKGVVTYMITDNLEVKPMSTISSLTLLNKFKVKDVGVLEERDVDLGADKGLELLKASLECKTVLTNVFLGKPIKN